MRLYSLSLGALLNMEDLGICWVIMSDYYLVLQIHQLSTPERRKDNLLEPKMIRLESKMKKIKYITVLKQIVCIGF